MRTFSFIASILVLAHETSTQAVTVSSSLYQSYPGLVWDNCTEPMLAPLLRCATTCDLSESCLGINFRREVDATKRCEICFSSSTKSVTQAPAFSNFSTCMYFRFNMVEHKPADRFINNVNLPRGLVDGQVIFFRTKPVNGRQLALLFKTRLTDNGPVECDLLLDAAFDADSLSYDITLSTYDESTQLWGGHIVVKPAGDFLEDGMDTYTVIFVHKLTYTVYINGKLLYVYPRSQRKSLEDIKLIQMIGNYPSISMMVW